MFAILKCLENAEEKTLCFASLEDAIRFKSFVNTYMEESGAGNGYDAYWVMSNAKIVQVSEIMDDFCTTLDYNLIAKMLEEIINARTAGNRQGIIFSMSELPARQRPGPGDMIRALFSQGAKEKIEGRVLSDNGDTFEVINYWDEDDNGKPKKSARVITVPASSVMKIDDWKKEYRKM
ncbi:MAG: hypothetical protein WC460_06600 [Patescibacteria group bacterium]